MTPATAMGHLNQRRQNIRSTSKTSITSEMEAEAVTPDGLGSKTHIFYAVVVDQGKLYTDLTGKFPVISNKGNWYVMVCYSYDFNYIKAVPMKSRSDVKLLPLPQPPVRARTDARTNPSAQRATQLRSVLARVYAVSIQNQITTTVP
jgi:hypothetical protein